MLVLFLSFSSFLTTHLLSFLFCRFHEPFRRNLNSSAPPPQQQQQQEQDGELEQEIPVLEQDLVADGDENEDEETLLDDADLI